ncbi:MAG: right-handed parallel beta-helix repeat-containing protein [Hyphomicrobiaceae bacterium]
MKALISFLIVIGAVSAGSSVVAAVPVSPQFENSRKSSCALPDIVDNLAVADVRNFGARGNGVDDDTSAINAAIRSLKGGGTVLFPPGRYVHNDVIAIASDNITLEGRDAELFATNPDRSAVIIGGKGSGLRNLTISAVRPEARGQSNLQSGIVVKGEGVRIARTRVSNTKSAGIWISGGRDYVITCNDVVDTKSDGIHSTDGATNGRVSWNRIYNSGDDGISVVSYRSDKQASSITIENNTVEHIRWGRGISVIGSTDVTIRRNRVSLIAMAAGIIVAREASYNTPGASSVIIEHNVVIDDQQKIAPLGGATRTGHGAIEINSDDDQPAAAVANVTINANRVDGAAFDGVRLLGNVCNVRVTSNVMSEIGGKGVNVASHCTPALTACQDNLLDGETINCP